MVLIARESSIDDVLKEIQRTSDDIALSVQLVADAHISDATAEKYWKAFSDFFADYDIEYPAANNPVGVRKKLEEAVEKHGERKQVALEAVKGVTKLAGKVIFFARDAGKDPWDYVNGMFATIAGLPLEQLYANPDRRKQMDAFYTNPTNTSALGNLSVRDRISEQLTLEKAGVPYMLELLADTLPEIAERMRDSREQYMEFLDKALTQLLQLYMDGQKPPLEEVKETIAKMAQIYDTSSTNGNGRQKLTLQLLEDLANTYAAAKPDEVDPTLTKWFTDNFGAPLQAVHASARKQDGGHFQVAISVGYGNDFRKQTLQLGTAGLPAKVADALWYLQQSCPAATQPGHLLSSTNARAGPVLQHHISR